MATVQAGGPVHVSSSYTAIFSARVVTPIERVGRYVDDPTSRVLAPSPLTYTDSHNNTHADIHSSSSLRHIQEHLSRHQQARHSDILRRHELGHQRKADGSTPTTKTKREPTSRKRQSNNDPDAAFDAPAPKASRSARAYSTKSLSIRLRCDGELPCARCKRSNTECTFDRTAVATPASSTQGDGQGSNLASSRSDDESGDQMDDSGDDETYVDHSVQVNAMPPLPAPPQWPHGIPQAAAQPMSPYAAPHRPSPLHQSSLPPASFHQQSASLGSPSFYHARPPDPFYRSHSPYQQMAVYAGQPPPPPPPAFTSSGANPLPTIQAPVQSSPFDTAAYGRASTGTGDPGLGQVDFLDLIAGASSSNDGSDIDWTLLNSGYTPRSEILTPQRGHDDASGGTAGDPNAAFSALTSALASPNTIELEASILGNIQQQNSSLRQSLHDIQQDSESKTALASGGGDGIDGGAIGAGGSGTNQTDSLPIHAPIATVPMSQAQEAASALAIQGSAAETLLQLASHTPRGSPEPEHRTSHPVHNLADPWPLSYRPTEKTERLDKGASRAASPRPGVPGGAPHQPSHVPSVTASTRARVADKVREIGEVDRFVPKLELLDLFVQLYFEHFGPVLPMLHKPTFDPNTCPSFLLLAVASVGARYAYDRVMGAKMHGHALTEIARRMYQAVSDTDNTLVRTVGWQQSMLLILFTGLASGNKRDLERAQACSSMPITFSRRQGWFKEPKVDETHERTFSLEERWKRWRDREEIKRLGFATLVFDSMSTTLWNHESSSLYLDAAKTSLPCHDTLWEAPTAVAWQALFRGSLLPVRGLETLTAVRLATDRSTHGAEALVSTARDSFAMLVVLGTLHSLGWTKNHEINMTSLFLPAAATQTSHQLLGPQDVALETGYEFFQDRVLLPPEMQAVMSDPGPTSSTLALNVHLACMTQYVPLRVLQPLARTGEWGPGPDIFDAVHAWAKADNGRLARKAAYHAGQLLALCRSTSNDSPLEPFALFYSALVLLSFCRELPKTLMSAMNGIVKNEHVVDGATRPPTPTFESSEPRYQLDKLVDQQDPELQAWINGAGAGTSRSAWITDVGELDAKGAGIRLLRLLSRSLIALKVWKVGELLGRTLIELANEEERKASMLRQLEQLGGDPAAAAMSTGSAGGDASLAGRSSSGSMQQSSPTVAVV
ncbi:hypothetical protein OIO90_001894 [Microbotryomycetes sp. JL221]|nr:hypothetical protein OIO90_001894 [Microbotryomycetes sp. JL221]